MSKEDGKEFFVGLKKIMLENEYDIALSKFDELCEKYRGKYPYFMKMLQEKKGHYLAYTKYTMEVEKYRNNTNAVEGINSMLGVIRNNSGGYYQSIERAKVSIYVVIKRLRDGVEEYKL